MQLISKTKGWLAMGRCNKVQARCLRKAVLTALLWHTKGDLGPSRFKVLTPFLESTGDLLDGCESRHRVGDYLLAAPLKPLQMKEVCRSLTRGVDRRTPEGLSHRRNLGWKEGSRPTVQYQPLHIRTPRTAQGHVALPQKSHNIHLSDPAGHNLSTKWPNTCYRSYISEQSDSHTGGMCCPKVTLKFTCHYTHKSSFQGSRQNTDSENTGRRRGRSSHLLNDTAYNTATLRGLHILIAFRKSNHEGKRGQRRGGNLT